MFAPGLLPTFIIYLPFPATPYLIPSPESKLERKLRLDRFQSMCSSFYVPSITTNGWFNSKSSTINSRTIRCWALAHLHTGVVWWSWWMQLMVMIDKLHATHPIPLASKRFNGKLSDCCAALTNGTNANRGKQHTHNSHSLLVPHIEHIPQPIVYECIYTQQLYTLNISITSKT